MCLDPVNLRNRQARQNSETVVRAPRANGDRVNGVSKMVCSVLTGGPVWPSRTLPAPTRETPAWGFVRLRRIVLR